MRSEGSCVASREEFSHTGEELGRGGEGMD